MTADRERTRYYTTRPRRVPPEFCMDELLESCSVLAALLLYRLISQADDQGRMPGAPKYVRAICFGMRPEVTERKVAAAIDELVRCGFLILYDLKARVFLQVDNWHDLQGKWGRRAYPSRYPAPPGWTHDWVSVKEDVEPELRAPDAQSASGLHPPIPVTPPFPIPVTPPGLGKAPGRSGTLERLGEILEGETPRRMTDEEAFAMGTALVNEPSTGRRPS